MTVDEAIEIVAARKASGRPLEDDWDLLDAASVLLPVVKHLRSKSSQAVPCPHCGYGNGRPGRRVCND